MSQHSSRSLDDSWIVNDTDDGEISWAGESTPPDSQEDDMIPEARQPSPRRTHSRIPQRVVNPNLAASAEPELIMPSIVDMSAQPRQRVASRKQDVPSTSARTSKSRSISARTIPARTRPPPPDDQDPIGKAMSLVGTCLMWFLETIGQAFRLLKTPIAIVLAGYMVLAFVQLAQNLLTNSIYTAMSPICRIPGASMLGLPMCQTYYQNHPKLSAGGDVPDPEFEALMKVQSQFETIMSDTAASASLPMDMKRSEISIRDLRQLVRFSQLPSRHELMHELDAFVETARMASYDLQKFDSHVGRSVDIVLSTNRWTRRVLDDMDMQQTERGLLPAFVSDTLLAPFKPLKFTESRLLEQYIQHSHVVSGEIETLIEEAQAILSVLQNLEDRLDVMAEVSARDNIQVQGSKDEVLREIWSYIGLNNKKLGKHDNQLKLLGMVAGYRKAALAHVTSVLIHLQSMGAELEELRDRVASPAVLQEAGVKHVPLSVHIENIQLGVERLEAGREHAKELQHKQTRRILDRADGDGDLRYIASG